MFTLKSEYSPSGDQPKAIEELTRGVLNGDKHQVLLGATGTGKNFHYSKCNSEYGQADSCFSAQ